MILIKIEKSKLKRTNSINLSLCRQMPTPAFLDMASCTGMQQKKKKKHCPIVPEKTHRRVTQKGPICLTSSLLNFFHFFFSKSFSPKRNPLRCCSETGGLGMLRMRELLRVPMTQTHGRSHGNELRGKTSELRTLAFRAPTHPHARSLPIRCADHAPVFQSVRSPRRLTLINLAVRLWNLPGEVASG